MDVDIVILWVDGNDPEWLSEYNKYCDASSKKNNAVNRFRDWNNLHYLFRGIDKFLPWVRKVHLVTFGHIPAWLNVSAEKISIHKHSDIFKNKAHLPVFNASSIELNINNIQGLAENFIYFNDDFFVLNELPISRFFKDNKPVDFLIEEPSRTGWLYDLFRNKNVWTSMINNSLREINSHFSKRQLLIQHKELFFNKKYNVYDNIKNIFFSYNKHFNAFEHYHLPQPYCRRTLKYAEEYFCDVIEATSASRFRSHDNVSQALYRYIHLARGDFYPEKKHDYAIFSMNTLSSLKYLESNIKKYSMVCINDEVETENEFLTIHSSLIDILNEILPEKSCFEI